MNVKYAVTIVTGIILSGLAAQPVAAQTAGVQAPGSRPQKAVAAQANPQAQPSAAALPSPQPVPQLDASQPAANQMPPLNGIQPVDNQAIMNGLADATNPGQTSAESNAEKSRRMAFDAALNGLFPMNPGEIKTLIDRLHENENAISVPQYANEKAEIKAETISLEPGSDPKEIQMDVGFVTTISILDATGNPWPIQDIGIGGNFDVPAPEEGSNVIRMTPLAKYAVGNMSMRLVGLDTPLSFKLRATTGTVYYRYDARIPKFGPKASAPLIEHGNDMVAGDTLLMNILDGMPPLDSTRLTVTGVDQRTAAWRVGTKVYLRTPLMLLSPGWEGSVGSADGTHVYLIPDTPVLLLSDNGHMVHGRIGNNSKVDEQPVPAIEDGMAHPLRPSAAVLSQSANGGYASQSASGGYASSGDILPSPGSSRTLIRPVPARTGGTAAAAQTPATTAQTGTQPAASTTTSNQGAQQ